MTTKKLVEKITQLIFEKKGSEVKVIELKTVSAIADYFVICSADSDTHVRAIADNIDKTLRDKGIKLWHKEGTTALQWVLLDYVDVVIHVFQKDIRAYYNLEKLWGDAPIMQVEDKPTKVRASKPKTEKVETKPRKVRVVKPKMEKVETKPRKVRVVKPKMEKVETKPKKVSAVKPKTKKDETIGRNG
ncbi:MAG: ribosome silencing factor [Ignavibacteriaceae bacterium]|nr:ribosome silencing factor [Ignavibacteriaceae bacterium]